MAARSAGQGGCVYRSRSKTSTFASPLPPSYEEGAFKRFAPLCGAIFYKGGAKRRSLIPLDPFFGKRGAAAAAGYSSPWSVAEGSDNRIAAPPRRFAPPLRRRGKTLLPRCARHLPQGGGQFVKKLKSTIFSGGMYVGKNTFCRPSVPRRGARRATAESPRSNSAEFERGLSHVPFGSKCQRHFEPVSFPLAFEGRKAAFKASLSRFRSVRTRRFCACRRRRTCPPRPGF